MSGEWFEPLATGLSSDPPQDAKPTRYPARHNIFYSPSFADLEDLTAYAPAEFTGYELYITALDAAARWQVKHPDKHVVLTHDHLEPRYSHKRTLVSLEWAREWIKKT